MIRKATISELSIIQRIVRETVSEIYPNYYPLEVVQFFLNHHNEENIIRDLNEGNVYLLLEDNIPVGTGTVVENSMNRVFVLPQHQGKGYGTQLMDFLENKISEQYDSIILDSSLPGFNIYIKRGYKQREFLEEPVENGRILFYPVMTKDTARKQQK